MQAVGDVLKLEPEGLAFPSDIYERDQRMFAVPQDPLVHPGKAPEVDEVLNRPGGAALPELYVAEYDPVVRVVVGRERRDGRARRFG
jgi:hypothetical protein